MDKTKQATEKETNKTTVALTTFNVHLPKNKTGNGKRNEHDQCGNDKIQLLWTKQDRQWKRNEQCNVYGEATQKVEHQF